MANDIVKRELHYPVFLSTCIKVIYTCTNVHEHQYQSHDTKKGPRSSSNKLSIKEKYPTTASKVVYLCIFVSASKYICFVPTVFNLHRKKIKNNRLCGAWNILFFNFFHLVFSSKYLRCTSGLFSQRIRMKMVSE